LNWKTFCEVYSGRFTEEVPLGEHGKLLGFVLQVPNMNGNSRDWQSRGIVIVAESAMRTSPMLAMDERREIAGFQHDFTYSELDGHSIERLPHGATEICCTS
jgi:hypothetical protein